MSEQYKKHKIVFVAYENEVKRFIELFFEGMGVEKSRYELVREKRRYRSVCVPDMSYYPGRGINNTYWISAFDYIIHNYCSKMASLISVCDKVYLSQTHYKSGDDIFGERVIEKIFAQNGYKIIYPEELPLNEQVLIYNNADIVVCTNGTLSHNGVWMKKHARLVILNRFIDEHENPHQKYIDCARGYSVCSINACHKQSIHDCGYMMLTKELRSWMCQNDVIASEHFAYFLCDKDYYKYILMRIKWMMLRLKSRVEEIIE